MRTLRISRNQDRRVPRHPQARRWRPLLEDLEGRQLLSTFTVTNTNNSGSGSLRQAIIASNAATGPSANTIDFDIGSGGTKTITLQSALPVVTQSVTIDGTTQPGTGAAPRIVLNGSSAGKSVVGLKLTASNCTVKGLAIDDFTSDGVVVSSASGDVITDDYIGVAPAGSKAGNGGNGVTIVGSSSDNTVGGTASGAGNVISGNQAHGVNISGADDNVVQGNLIGTNSLGTGALGNGDSGVIIQNNADDNLIGGTTPGAANTLSGNDLRGVHITSGSSGNLVEGNLIGTNSTGTAAVANDDSGVLIDGSSTDNTIGGTVSGAGNTISGNGLRGVHISGGSSGNLVEGNLIGTDAAGTTALGNSDSGVLIDGSSTNNTVGGTVAGAGNTISGNLEDGVHITGGSSGNVIEGNLIGTNSAGTGVLGNAVDGVLIDGNSANNTVGGAATGAGNTISNNLYGGVTLNCAGNGNVLRADVIDANGFSQPTPGLGNGVSVIDTKYTSVLHCTIDSNRDWGILVKDSSHTVLTGNTLHKNGLGGILTN
jgi:parallel beta-helix repeat protein